MGTIKKKKNIDDDEDEEDKKDGSAWDHYMKEVRKYKEKFGDDDSDKNRPLVKWSQIFYIVSNQKINLSHCLSINGALLSLPITSKWYVVHFLIYVNIIKISFMFTEVQGFFIVIELQLFLQ